MVGRVTAPQGLRGEVRVQVLSDFPERFQPGARLWVAGRPTVVEAGRRRGNLLVLKLAGCDDRDAAEALRDVLLEIPERERLALPPGSFYIYELVGLEVYTPEGERLGALTAVEKNPAQDLFVVAGPTGEILVPALRQMVREVDLAAGRMVVDLPPGLREV